METTPLVLVADDEPGIRDFLAGTLADAGFRVVSATNGHEALAAVRQERPAAVVTDLMMPGMTGWELCAALRADAATARLPVIAMSAVAPDGVAADAFLAKPFALEALLRLLAQVGAGSGAPAARRARRSPTGRPGRRHTGGED
jgi:CheY-like chemotaxis protein